ncbi:PAS domain-containing sensor histidine kinase [Pontibacter arcticus]|uniref:histidine kinase n=1 Tax=Pontibacter arcticus TaxID=2080288 RepID=A0A364REV3_9BACT|nr:PAS domain S-box protein [Pontibacter arcticus]RAU82797.1 hypothetical protein DP923_05970 [Pontibacter arcticus]
MDSSEQTRNFFLALLENSTDLLSIIDAQGNYQFVGGSVKHILGFTPDELVGKSAFDFIHPEDKENARTFLQKAASTKVLVIPIFRFTNKQGNWRWVETTLTNMVKDAAIQGYVTNTRDVTERVEEEQRKKKSQAHYESLFYNHPDAVFELDREGFMRKINKRMPSITGYTEEEILGSHFRKFVHNDYLPVAMDAFLNALGGIAQHIEIAVLKPTGELVDLNIAIVPVLLEGHIESIQCIANDITLLRKYDTFLKERSEQLNSIMERIPESFYALDTNWRFTYVNSFFTAYTKLTREELLGHSIWELFPNTLGSKFHHNCLKVIKTGLPANFDEQYSEDKDATISYHIFPTGKGVGVHFVDITEKKRELDKLEKLSLVASKTTTCVMLMNSELQIEWVNEAFEKLTQFSLEDCLHKYPWDLLTGPETQARTLTKIQKQISRGKPFRGEILNYKKSGEKVWFNLEITPVHNNLGRMVKFIAIRTDITEKKIKEAELVHVTQDLFQQNHDLQQFSYMVSHNLRAPAANVLGLTEILLVMDKHARMFDETLRKLNQSVATLDQVIRDMNHILTIRDNSYAQNRDYVNITQVCEEVLESLQEKLYYIPHTISADLDEKIEVWSNRAYMYEIFRNLLSNAIKFRKPNEVLKLEIRMKRQKNGVTILVKDNGIGMDVHAVENDIFKLYMKFHKAYEGRGIGLFLVKTYVNALGGSIKVKSEPAIGTTFKIKLKGNAK